MDNGRQKLNEEDLKILNSCKTQLDIHINYLLERGVRRANIQIELEWHIRNLLKGD